jgi:transcriptional regulator with XRE-family HTH domain
VKLKIDSTLSKIKSFLDLDTQAQAFSRLDRTEFISGFIPQLIERRKQLDWSLETMESKTGIASSTIQAFEDGDLNLTWEELQRYVKSLGLAFCLVEEIPLEDLINKQSTTELLGTLMEGQIAFGDCGKYIIKDPATKAIMECSEEGELLGPLSLTPEVMNSRWRILKRDDAPTYETSQADRKQNELEKEIFVNLIYSDLNYNQLALYLSDVKGKIDNPELAELVSNLYNQLQKHLSSDESTLNAYEIKNDIRESKERIVEYFFRGIELRNKSVDF